MKRGLWVAALLLVAAVGAVFVKRNSALHSSVESGNSSSAVGVDDLMRNPHRCGKGLIRVEGVVSHVVPGDRRVTLIDRREFEKCGLGCAELTLPVRWSGPMPAVRDLVCMEGEVQDEGGKLIFIARTVEPGKR